ncbi:ATP-binding cassette domain-containing protein [Xylocopilactobacillus apis]|uniref:Cytochrome bd biosynthesis protein n=1 Tax=Xylocopilactobacillus apis TaxID=2932183 RepID=A0AAU9DS31_9LACO|nr:ATP-binding cassette domain-containing protein [Xylocopilactobacillus apis]BDR56463.1 cytochrome bd biosynthesis protein [Xylocopilactobacillus apis]
MIKRLFSYGKAGRMGALQQIVNEWLIMVLPVLTAAVIFFWYQTGTINFTLTSILIAILVLTIIYFNLPRARSRIEQWTITAKQQIRKEYLQGVFNTDPVKAEKLNAETVINRDLQGIDRLNVFYNSVFPSFCAEFLSYILLLILAIAWHSWVWILPIICILLIGVGMMLLQKVGPQVNWAYMNGWLSMGHRFIDDLHGINTLMVYKADTRYRDSFSEKSEFFRQKTMDLLKYQLQSLLILNSLIFGTLAVGSAMLWFNLKNQNMSLAQSLVLWVLMAELLITERQLGYFVHIIMSTKPAMTHIFHIIDHAKTPTEFKKDSTVESINEIKVEDASFAYPDKPLLWENANFDLKPGKLYGLVGHNGSGKSTLAQVLRGQLKISSGIVSCLSADNQNESTNLLAQRVGYLSAQPYLFSGTIKENLTLGEGFNSDWQGYLKDLGLCEFVEKLPEGFNTQVGEGGKLLSPGQRQQIAFARLILMNKDVYIFDEVTASIDSNNSKIILKAIKKLAAQKIVLLITHEWTIIDQLDFIYFLTDRHFVLGTVDELDQQNDAFKKMMSTQKDLEAEL